MGIYPSQLLSWRGSDDRILVLNLKVRITPFPPCRKHTNSTPIPASSQTSAIAQVRTASPAHFPGRGNHPWVSSSAIAARVAIHVHVSPMPLMSPCRARSSRKPGSRRHSQAQFGVCQETSPMRKQPSRGKCPTGNSRHRRHLSEFFTSGS